MELTKKEKDIAAAKEIIEAAYKAGHEAGYKKAYDEAKAIADRFVSSL